MHWTEAATADDSHAELESRTLASLLKTMPSLPVGISLRNLPRHSETKPGGQERVTDTARLARLNLAVHGLSGDIKQGNTYYEDLQDSVGRFDFVLALPSAAARSLPRSHPADRPKRRINPPFNVSKIDKERLAVSF